MARELQQTHFGDLQKGNGRQITVSECFGIILLGKDAGRKREREKGKKGWREGKMEGEEVWREMEDVHTYIHMEVNRNPHNICM